MTYKKSLESGRWNTDASLRFFPPREREVYWSPAESTTALQPKKCDRLVNKINNLQEYLGKQWCRCAAGRPKSTALQPKFTAFSRTHSAGPRSEAFWTAVQPKNTALQPKFAALQPKKHRSPSEIRPHFDRTRSALQPKKHRTPTEISKRVVQSNQRFTNPPGGVVPVLNTSKCTYTVLNNNILWVVVVVPFGFMQNANNPAAPIRGKS
jgi:hypothetical protein